MTDDMLALARENRERAGATNVEFLKGEIEHIPLPNDSVDVIISNCVINLSADKAQVIREAFRVLKPVGDSPCRTSSCAARLPGRSPAPASRSTPVVSPARWRRVSTAALLAARDFPTSASSRRASTRRTTHVP